MGLFSSLKRTGSNKYVAMLVAKTLPANWSPRTLLLRFVEQNGASTCFRVSGDAIPSYDALEKWRIYDMTIAGSCVKTADAKHQVGVSNPLEVRIKFPSPITLSKASWSFTFPYHFTTMESLNQIENGKFIDIIGCVSEQPIRDMNSPIPKMTIVLADDHYSQAVDLLYGHTAVDIKRGDTVACGGVRLTEWKSQRSLETSFLTILEVNPIKRAGIPVLTLDDEEPKRKAMKMSKMVPLTVAVILQEHLKLLKTFETSQTLGTMDMTVVATLPKLDTSFFEQDPPLVGDDPKEKMCWKTKITDCTGEVAVKVWDKACHTIFKVTASKMRQIWESGSEDPDKQPEILETLNECLEQSFIMNCTANVWSYGYKTQKADVQMNVNLVEASD